MRACIERGGKQGDQGIGHGGFSAGAPRSPNLAIAEKGDILRACEAGVAVSPAPTLAPLALFARTKARTWPGAASIADGNRSRSVNIKSLFAAGPFAGILFVPKLLEACKFDT